jgi:opacity protein-like surface antigen
MPKMVGFGFAYLPTEQLTISADYESRTFSEFKVKSDLGDQEFEWEDVNQLRLGAEYLLMSGESILPVRLGIATTPTPLKDYNDDQITGINLCAGIGIIMGNINLDLGIEYNTYMVEGSLETGGTYNASDNYLRFLVSGVFHLGK